MAEPIVIRLDTTKYRTPTDEDIRQAKRFINIREQYAGVLQDRIDEVIADGAERIVTICYRYDVKPKDLYFSSAFNSDMMNEIAEVMDDIEGRILDLIYEYSTRASDDKDRISVLAAWMALLGKGSRNLRDTLDGYLYKMMKDWEAAIAALRYAGTGLADAVARIRTHLHSIYTIPEVIAAFRRAGEFTATYIRSKGIQYGAAGLSNNGSTNVTNMAATTLRLVWKHNQQLDFEQEETAGFYVLRGSSYLCDWCDSYVGWHNMDEPEALPPQHPHCMCYAVPIYKKEDETITI